MKTTVKKMICLILALAVVIACFTSCKDENGFNDKVEVTGMGLHVSENGWITLNGRPFYGFGFVFKDAFKMRLSDPSTDLEPYFAKLKEGGIPFVRIMLGFDTVEMVRKYMDERDAFFSAMDYVVETAKKYEIGIVANLFWDMECVATANWDNLDKMMTQDDSNSYKFCVKYIDDVVTRYKDAPSVWAWEITNEANLWCEVKKIPKEYTDGSIYNTNFTTEKLKQFYTYASEEIRKADPYRMITNGDSSPRFFSKALREDYNSAPWDTYEDIVETFSIYTSGSIDCQSIHTPYISYLEKYTKAARELKKGLYVGAFSGSLYTNLDESKTPENDVYEANERDSFNAYVDAYLEYGIQMAAVRNFASYAVDPEDDASVEVGTESGVFRNTYVWDRIVSENAKLVTDGKNNASEYWGFVRS